ncbi:hypothetical protein HBI12_197510 [Parastagonospora nodorum]|nr:hypothetical protein HBI12_197510 [Parastagonospora nodorum]
MKWKGSRSCEGGEGLERLLSELWNSNHVPLSSVECRCLDFQNLSMYGSCGCSLVGLSFCRVAKLIRGTLGGDTDRG